ncbi:platelet glycoprotein 4-like [Pantherophis guttatus]|uniref:Platelet glycoprotein 4 n=1 Tax=Pantherophis guttatus TaxID=94885 RepID=A0A6P9AX68_PANGU|nr:platelet glycoprotein 4-like [Pantherophis guttatus]
MGCNTNCGLLTVATVGAVVAILGGILIPVGKYFVRETIKKEVVLENGTIGYENWILPGSTIYREFWVFDVQNPEDVMENGSPPILKQKGPYTYKMRYLPKENIMEHEDATLSYLQPNIIIFQPDKSVGPENDTFTTLNLAIVAAPALFKNGFLQTLMNIWMKSSKSNFLQTRTVKEILWGYEDPFLKKLPIIKIDRVVGVFYPYNGTFDGPYRIYSGKDDINKKGTIVTFNNSRTLQYWTSYCNMVNGTDATSFHPFVQKSEKLYFFSSDVCRSVFATFQKDVIVKDIPLYRFTVPPSSSASSVTNPDNICFCTDWEITYNCSVSGFLDISSCKQGKPVYLSSPHFLNVDQREFKYVKGLEPNKKEHSTFLDVEPITGLTLTFAKRLQVNLLVRPNLKITALRNVKHHFYFPILWLNESAIISDEKAEFFRSKVTNKIKLLQLLQLALMIVGSVTFLGFLFAFFICKGKNPK